MRLLLAAWRAAPTRPKRSCCARCGSARPIASFTCTRSSEGVGAVAKGIRRTKSRFGARLEPLSHVELVLHEGRRAAHGHRRRPPARPPAGAGRLVPARCRLRGAGGDARLFPEQERTPVRSRRSRASSTCSTRPSPARARRPATDPLALSFQLGCSGSGYLPHLHELRRVRRRGRARRLLAAGGRGGVQVPERLDLISAAGLRGIETLLRARSRTRPTRA